MNHFSIGIGISKSGFPLHGATADEAPVLRKKLSRCGKVLEFLASQVQSRGNP